MIKILHDKRGDVTVQAVGIILILLIIIVPIYHYCRILTIANGVNNAVRNEIIKTVSVNYEPAYNGMREANSGAYKISADIWQSDIKSYSVMQNLSSELSLQQNGNTYIKNDGDGKKLYSINNIQINIQNADFRSNSRRLSAHASYNLSVPIELFGTAAEENFNMRADCEFEPKF